ncbi:hypothetical protein HYX12_03385 [Candidatus Woesearchaeota archaeon]|nr:hypothetical protein [Candidatus Woesearchaeota archaeon]
MVKEALIQAGLTNREVDTYLCLLKIGESSVGYISKKTKENRAHLYDTLNKLVQKGFVSSVIKNGKKYFHSAPPEKILDYLQEKQEKVKELLPELIKLSSLEVKCPLVEVFEGTEGIKTVLKDVLKENKEWLCLGLTGISSHLIPFFIEQFHRQRIKQKLPLRGIYNDDKIAQKRAEVIKKQPYTKVRLMHKTSPTTTYIYGQKVTIIIWEKEKLVAIKINDSDIAKSHRDYFEELWSKAKAV